MGIGSVGGNQSAPLPASQIPSTPKKTYKKITIRDQKTNKLRRVLMESSKADKLLARRKQGSTPKPATNTNTSASTPKPVTPTKKPVTNNDAQYIPNLYKSSVDPKSISKAVDAAIQGQIIPLNQLTTQQKAQYAQNLKDAASFNAQTQSTLEAALTNVFNGTGIMQGAAAQQAAALKDVNNQAANDLTRVMSGSQNANLASLLGNSFANNSVQNNQDLVNSAYGAGLSGQYQGDFFNRAKGIAGMTQQAFNNAQTTALNNTLGNIAAQIAAKKAERPNLIRQYATEEGQAAVEKAAAEAAFKLQADSTYAGLANDAAALAADTAAASGDAASQKNEKRNAEIQKIFEGVYATNATVGTSQKNKDGSVSIITSKDAFGKAGGPWRDAFNQLISIVNLPPKTAALLASKWFPGSITRSTPKKILVMLRARKVPEATIAGILKKGFGANGYKDAINAMKPVKSNVSLSNPISQPVRNVIQNNVKPKPIRQTTSNTAITGSQLANMNNAHIVN